MTQKSEYIKQISALSDRRHDYLLELMERYHVGSLQEVTEQQAKEFLLELQRSET